MDSEPFEYTKFPGPAAKPAAAKPKPSSISSVPAGAAAAAAVVVIAAVFAAGPLLFPAPAPAPAASAPVLEAPVPQAPVPAFTASDPGEARPSSPLPIAFGRSESAARTAGRTLPAPAATTARTPVAAAKPGPKPFRPPSLNGGSAWGGEKEAGPVAFTPEGGLSEEVAAQTTEKASWTTSMRARPITRNILSFAPGKVRADYAVDRTERPDYRVDKTPRADYQRPAAERADFRVDKSFRQDIGGTNPTLKPVGQGRGVDACVDCEEAGDAAGIAVGPGGRIFVGGVVAGGGSGAGGGGAGGAIGKLTYVGPCEEGQLYRLTNTLGRRLGSTTLIGNSGEVWDVGALQPGESAEIRSRGMISSLSTAP